MSDDLIRISHDEAFSEHVDSLLKRQANLRGDPGITRDRRSQVWYLRSWFVLMIAGGLAALAAWGLMEPAFDDALYWQGQVEEISTEARDGIVISHGGESYRLEVPVIGTATVRGVDIWLIDATRVISPDGSTGFLDPEQLDVGTEVGLYLEYQSMGSVAVAIAHYVRLAPPPLSVLEEHHTIEQLARRDAVSSFLLFPVVAGLVALAIGAADGIICRLPRRVLLAGGVGLLIGFFGGFFSFILANIIYAPLTHLAMSQSGDMAGGLSATGFLVQMVGRGLAWGVAGMAMGLGQGIALRSGRLVLYGFLGGVMGGLLGGLLFDPINLILQGGDAPSAWLSRGVGFTAIGATVGAMIGVVELLARDAWLRMLEGPLAGKEFLIFKDTMRVGSSPRSDVYLFNDQQVAAEHAIIRAIGDEYELENLCQEVPVTVNGVPISRTRLRNGDQLTLGRTVFLFQKRRS